MSEELLHHIEGGVRRPVINDKYLNILMGLVKGALYASRNDVCSVVCRYDDTDFGQVTHLLVVEIEALFLKCALFAFLHVSLPQT